MHSYRYLHTIPCGPHSPTSPLSPRKPVSLLSPFIPILLYYQEDPWDLECHPYTDSFVLIVTLLKLSFAFL